jgi:hypothetical protein
VVEVPAFGAVVLLAVLLGCVVDDGTVVLPVLLGLVVDDELVVVVDFGGAVVGVVVVEVVGEAGLEADEGRGGYWRYRAPNPRKATAISAVDRRTRSRRLTGRLMKPRSPRFGRSGRGRLGRIDGRRLASNGLVLLSWSLMAPSWFHRLWAES